MAAARGFCTAAAAAAGAAPAAAPGGSEKRPVVCAAAGFCSGGEGEIRSRSPFVIESAD